MIALLSAILLKGSVLMTAAAAVAAVMSRASAATRHFIWTLTIVGLLALPVFTVTLPTWEVAVPVEPIERSTAIDVVRSMATTAASPVTRTTSPVPRLEEPPSAWVAGLVPALLVVTYPLGVLVLLARLVIQHRTARRLVRESTAVTDPDWTSLLEECATRIGVTRHVALHRSRVELMPMTTGTLASSIVVPAGADAWDAERRRAVLLHEVAHIARHDCLTQLLSAIASAVYWFHPGVWYVARRLRIERELACDDRVLNAGAHAPEYAGHLLELAYSWSGRRASALVVGMASSRKLEGRMRAVLDPARNRTAPTGRMWLLGAAVSAGVLLPLAAITMTTASADVRRTSANVRRTLMASSSEQDAQTQERGAPANTAEQPIGSADNVAGTWRLRPSSRSRDHVFLEVTAGAFSSNGDLLSSEIEGLTAQSLADAKGPVRFSISREAGTLQIEGTIDNGTGSGTFRFVPSDTFIAGLTRRGFTRPTAQQLFALARNDIGFEFIDELAAQKYERPGRRQSGSCRAPRRRHGLRQGDGSGRLPCRDTRRAHSLP